MGLSLPQKYASTKIALTKMNAGSALSFCLRMHQHIHPVVKLKLTRHSFPPSFLHSIYFPLFFSLSLLPFQSPTGIGFIFHFLRIRCFWLSHTWLPVNIILARSSFMVIRYLPFSHVCVMKLIAFIKTFILDVHRTESRKEYRKGKIHEIPGIFFAVRTVCIYYSHRQPDNCPGIWYLSNVSNIKLVM